MSELTAVPVRQQTEILQILLPTYVHVFVNNSSLLKPLLEKYPKQFFNGAEKI